MEYLFEEGVRIGISLKVTDNGIIYTTLDKEIFYPYGSIKDISLSWVGNITIKSKSGSCSKFSYQMKDKAILKELINDTIKSKIRTASNANEIITSKVENDETSKQPKQYYKKCASCGYIFHFTEKDLNDNKLRKEEHLHELGFAALSALGGTLIESNQHSASARELEKDIIDYNICPECHSSDLIDATEEEYKAFLKPIASTSAADEILKFKELLDSGIISQEEFDAKKKQLLGL